MPEWLWTVAVGVVISGLAGIIWRAHEKRDDERFRDIWDAIGRDSQSGMRKTLHDANNRSLGNRELLERIEERLKGQAK